jgi:hypothetical protein
MSGNTNTISVCAAFLALAGIVMVTVAERLLSA